MTSITSGKAINRVLLAEKKAKNKVNVCRHKAAYIITNGRERVRGIMNRADERISKVHVIADRITEQTLVEINIDTNLLSEPIVLDDRKNSDIALPEVIEVIHTSQNDYR